MPAPLQSTFTRLTGAVGQMSLAQKVFAVLAAAAVVIAAVAVGGWVTRPTMTPLFSGLSGSDASAIVDQLAADGVAYELSDGGSTIMVPAGDVYAERIAMAAQGLPASSDGDGYSLLDDLSATSTQFQEQTTYQRAMEGELAKTIAAMNGVESASVKLAIPADTVFSEQKEAATASVFLREKVGSSLSPTQVQAIVHLVSAAIPGMAAGDVAVIDANGDVLSTVGTSSGSALSDQQTGQYEDKVEAAVHELLDPLVGASNVTVTATAVLNYDQQTTTIESYQADENVPPLASSTTTEQYGTATGTGATGVLGPDNIAVPSTTTNDGSDGYSSTSEDVTNAVGKTTEQIVSAPGTVERQSVSVAIDATAANALDLTALQSAIAAAVGIDATRGDVLSVQRMPFDQTAADEAAAALVVADKEAKAAATRELITQGGMGALVLLALIAAVVVGLSRSRRAKRESLDLGPLDAAPEPVSLDAALAVVPELDTRPAEPDPVSLKRQQIASLADDQPDEVADLLRGWLTEGSRR
jgi:flagellar M-ring protein FliF